MFFKQLLKVLSVSILLNSFVLVISFISVSTYLEDAYHNNDATHLNIHSYLYTDNSFEELISNEIIAIQGNSKDNFFSQSSSKLVIRQLSDNFVLSYITLFISFLYLSEQRSRAPPSLLFS
jgi:uncharacterized membrane protein